MNRVLSGLPDTALVFFITRHVSRNGAEAVAARVVGAPEAILPRRDIWML